MIKNSNLHYISNLSKEPMQKSRYGLTQLHIQSMTKVPKLQSIIDQWKLQMQTQPNNLDMSLLPPQSDIDDKDVFIDHLTRKVQFLEGKINHLCQKHIEICMLLCTELEKKRFNEEFLRKENIELNKQMKTVVSQMKQIISKIYNSDEQKIRNVGRNSFGLKLTTSKQNIPPSNLNNYRMSLQKLQSKSPRDRMHHKTFKLLSSKSIFKNQMSIARSQHSLKDLEPTVITRSKANQIDQVYYKKSKKQRLKKPERSNSKTTLQKSKFVPKKSDNKYFAEEYF